MVRLVPWAAVDENDEEAEQRRLEEEVRQAEDEAYEREAEREEQRRWREASYLGKAEIRLQEYKSYSSEWRAREIAMYALLHIATALDPNTRKPDR